MSGGTRDCRNAHATVDGARRAVEAGAVAAVVDALSSSDSDTNLLACTAISHLAAESSTYSCASRTLTHS